MRVHQYTLPLFNGLGKNDSIDEKLSTNSLSHHHRVQRWANFIAGYSVEFVEKHLLARNFNEDIVIDPFLGCGTTLVTAKNMGFRGLGYDRHNVFYTLACAKLNNFSISELQSVKEKLLNSSKSIQWSDDAIKFLSKLFDPQNLDKISRASYAVSQFDDKLHPLAVALFLKACEASCGSQTDGIYKAPTSKKRTIDFNLAVESIYNIFLEDIASEWYQDHWLNQPLQTCFNTSSVSMKEVKNSSVGICITSPPYLNNFDYAEMTRMHLYLLGWASSWGEISQKIRNHLITNTTTALKAKKADEYQNLQRDLLPQSLISELDNIVLSLKKQKTNRAGKKDYDLLIYPYYAEINHVLKELYRTMKSDGIIHWVIADAALYGIHIKTHLHTEALFRDLGFQQITVNFIRKRGHRWILNKREGAKEGLGEYHITAIKK